ncbi:MAG: hypothetical protein ABMA14_00050 [Hyphomonadaceae bacterium]
MLFDPDSVRNAAEAFVPQRLEHPLFLNSVPKTGTHLLRNILLMFVDYEQAFEDDFIQVHNVHSHSHAFSKAKPRFSWGHLNHTEEASRIVGDSRILALVRDPYSYVLSFTRFLFSDQEGSTFAQYVRAHSIPVERVISFVIFGNLNDAVYCPDLRNSFMLNGVQWLGDATLLVRYEELVFNISVLRKLDFETYTYDYFSNLLGHCGLAMPVDWRERVEAGADRRLSYTARENLNVHRTIPDSLSEDQKMMVEIAAPGLRAALGYFNAS